jgi:hypothetical protein
MSGSLRSIAGPPRSSLPTYVERGGEIVARHPSQAIGARLYGFLIKADRSDDFCDRTFNQPSRHKDRWRAAAGWVLLNFVDVLELRSANAQDRGLGFVHEHEAAIWMPVEDTRHPRLRWAIPYIFVDSQWALAGGREPYGFPKQLGAMNIPRDQNAPQALELRTTTMKEFGPGARAEDVLVVRAVRDSASPAPLEVDWGDPSDVLGSILARATGSEGGTLSELVNRVAAHPLARADEVEDNLTALVPFARDMGADEIPMMMLKQFRSALSPTHACYQAIIEVTNRLINFDQGGFLPDDYRVEFAKLDGEPILRDLGIAEGPQKATYPFWLEFDFSVEATDVLWSSGAHGD